MARNFPGSGTVYRPVEPTIGYSLSTSLIDEYWPTVPLAGVHCPVCASVLDYTAVSKSVDLTRGREITGAGARLVVGRRFRDLCRSKAYDDVNFVPLDVDWPAFELRPTRVVSVEWERSKPRLARLCPRCGQFDCILYGDGLFLKGVDKPLSEGIYRTDLMWGCKSGKWPDIIVAAQTMEKIATARIKGAFFWPVPYLYLIKPREPQGELGFSG